RLKFSRFLRKHFKSSSGGGDVGAAGSDSQVLFNDGGSLSGDAGLRYNSTTKLLKTYDSTYTSILGSSTTTRFTVGSTNTQVIPATNNFVGSESYAAVEMTNTTSKSVFANLSTLYLTGTPAGTVSSVNG